jgi:hypothetical protein
LKIVIVILFLPITLLSQASLDQKITRDYENEKLSYIISDLDKRTNFSFRYNETLLPINRLSYSFVETPLHQVLKIIFDRFDLRYLEYAPGQIIIAPKEIMNIEQEEVIFKEPNQEETKEEI